MNSEQINEVVNNISGKLGELVKTSEPFAEEAIAVATRYVWVEGVTGLIGFLMIFIISMIGIYLLLTGIFRPAKDSEAENEAKIIVGVFMTVVGFIMGPIILGNNLPKVIEPLGYLINKAIQ